jgi:hypothetical protein
MLMLFRADGIATLGLQRIGTWPTASSVVTLHSLCVGNQTMLIRVDIDVSELPSIVL